MGNGKFLGLLLFCERLIDTTCYQRSWGGRLSSKLYCHCPESFDSYLFLNLANQLYKFTNWRI